METKKQNTHQLASEKLIGSVVSIGDDRATVTLTITKEMIVDTYNLSHGSFVFGLADYAAMLAVNEPTVVLGKATSKFIKPVVLNDEVTAIAVISDNSNGKKVIVSVTVKNQKEELVFEGEFVCFVLEKHILED
ncbi:MaoC/PaaZ C-terminal domain-containing protein [Maribacter polysaccharolyticus]|uniref:MaoC/PaaZ C-terminal domain-containing protein n=1 Tax=Maribacter polysaccharolyticus TaxID=3020831 RepID=UPI00237F309A|nr:MaoC/PaaZ C-terminal domain-containing protein [Maribacter polysaccharolyticus]MDE3743434.1 MaoC/PaaZ C-terminal domain-containing protein [Maribacter polysaccharolyticus]